MKRETLAAEILASQPEQQGRVRDVVFYSGARIGRLDWWTGDKWWLTFSMKPEDVKLDRLNVGAPVLNSHSRFTLNDQIGVVEKGWIDGGKAKATLRFSERDDVTPIWDDIEAGVIRNISMGVNIGELLETTPKGAKEKEYLARDWEPQEISVTPLPADMGAQFLSGHPLQMLLPGMAAEDRDAFTARLAEQIFKHFKTESNRDVAAEIAAALQSQMEPLSAGGDTDPGLLAKLRIHSARLRLQ